ncbi:hypothetical protein PsYK624_065060 [Phanerochaete sordida]|uniref:Uncharacterized protein n=1 Tax=Phanerochaete sordida TaxID=48140 RepID=A0A9P3GAH7_9APHY|nr:hypothetical protein PsYK624_065060 [Phanerochaete sordida]
MDAALVFSSSESELEQIVRVAYGAKTYTQPIFLPLFVVPDSDYDFASDGDHRDSGDEDAPSPSWGYAAPSDLRFKSLQVLSPRKRYVTTGQWHAAGGATAGAGVCTRTGSCLCACGTTLLCNLGTSRKASAKEGSVTRAAVEARAAG